MRWMTVYICGLVVLLTTGLFAAQQGEKQQAVLNKAEVLEQHVAAEGDGQSPAPAEIITKKEVQAVDPHGTNELDDAITCLARTMYWEARGEDAASMEAIANVVMNRLADGGFPDTICQVVRQGQEQGACQFSWWCDGHSDDADETRAYAEAKEIARKALNEQLSDRTHGALYFHNKEMTPDWAAKYHKTAEIGAHIFYRPDDSSLK